MAAPTKVQLNWLSNAAKSSNEGFDFIRTLGGLAQDFADLAAIQSVAAADFTDREAGTFQGFDPASVPLVVEGVSKIVALLDADNGKFRKAFKALAQHAY